MTVTVMITGDKSAKQIILGLASKTGINMLHKSNHVISYKKILERNKAWSKMTATMQPTNSTSQTFMKVWQPTVPLTITMEDRKLGLGKEQPTTPTKLCFKQSKRVNKIYLLADISRSVTWLQKPK